MSVLTPIDASCLTCRWWCEGASDGSHDSCHRHAPPWPPATETDWCGDWEPDCRFTLKYEPTPRRPSD